MSIVTFDLGLAIAHRHMGDVALARIRGQHVDACDWLNRRYQSLINGKRSYGSRHIATGATPVHKGLS